VERHERAELATFIPFAMLELSIILFVLCGPLLCGLVSFELVNGYVICHALQIAVALILAIFLSTFARCLTFISIFLFLFFVECALVSDTLS
jgi:hypothetical protein